MRDLGGTKAGTVGSVGGRETERETARVSRFYSGCVDLVVELGIRPVETVILGP